MITANIYNTDCEAIIALGAIMRYMEQIYCSEDLFLNDTILGCLSVRRGSELGPVVFQIKRNAPNKNWKLQFPDDSPWSRCVPKPQNPWFV